MKAGQANLRSGNGPPHPGPNVRVQLRPATARPSKLTSKRSLPAGSCDAGLGSRTKSLDAVTRTLETPRARSSHQPSREPANGEYTVFTVHSIRAGKADATEVTAAARDLTASESSPTDDRCILRS